MNLSSWWKTRQLKRKLAAYKKTLRPSQAAWANDLEARLKNKTPTQQAAILRSSAASITQLQFRVIEKLDRVTNQIVEQSRS